MNNNSIRPHFLLTFMVLLFFLTACTEQTGGSTPLGQTKPTDPVVARINNLEFTQSQLDRELAFDRAIHRLTTGQELTRQAPEEKLERLTTSLLIDQKAREAGITVSEEEVTAALTAFAAERNSSTDELEHALQSQGVTLLDFKENVVARTVRVERFLAEVVLAEAKDPAQQQEKLVSWVSEVQENATIEILYEPPAEAPTVGAVAPDFTLTNLAGESVSLSQFRGQPVLLNFWATWCVPCRREMPAFQQAYEKHKDEDLVILAINLAEDASLVKPYVDMFDLSIEILYDSDGAINKQYLVSGLPRTVFIDRQGVIQHIQVGEVQEVLLEGFLGRIL